MTDRGIPGQRRPGQHKPTAPGHSKTRQGSRGRGGKPALGKAGTGKKAKKGPGCFMVIAPIVGAAIAACFMAVTV